MVLPVSSPLTDWTNFYVIVGSAAGALTGLQFVVMTLISEGRTPGSMREIQAFGTPTVIHFCAALGISAAMCVPWPALSTLGWCFIACAVAGIAYTLRTVYHAQKAAYNPDAEDWFWYTALPLFGHASLLTAAILLWSHQKIALFAIAALGILFLCLGIHNSWDTVTYIAVQRRNNEQEKRAD